METKSIRISQENYKGISEFAGELQQELGEPVSLDKALHFLLKKRKLSELAGSWKMSEKQAEDIKHNLRAGWNTWKIKYA